MGEASRMDVPSRNRSIADGKILPIGFYATLGNRIDYLIQPT
jgi:hypothetical protein